MNASHAGAHAPSPSSSESLGRLISAEVLRIHRKPHPRSGIVALFNLVVAGSVLIRNVRVTRGAGQLWVDLPAAQQTVDDPVEIIDFDLWEAIETAVLEAYYVAARERGLDPNGSEKGDTNATA